MHSLLAQAGAVADLLRRRGETLAVAESAAGGLISAALLAQPGASAFFRGGVVVYTREARRALLGLGDAEMAGLRPSTEAYAALLARTAQTRLGASWGIGETGAAGPTGNRYGDPAGHACLAVSGAAARAQTLGTGVTDREANMRAFAAAALTLLHEALATAPAT